VSARRILAVGLDGHEQSLEERLIEAGELPAMARLRRQSARYLLDHGPAQRTGLAWEHFSTGLSPRRAGRWAAVHFDPQNYAVWQEGTSREPFAARLKSRTVVFDAPYFDLEKAPHADGLVAWGAHDPGIQQSARPAELLAEFAGRFGEYPAKDWIYGHVWPSARRAEVMGEALARAVSVRSRAARWLLGERLPDWKLGIVVVSELHSAIEGLWHGLDASHPLHRLPSAKPAREGLIEVYRAVDRLIAELLAAFPDAAAVVFSMGGMGPNHSDVASMALLPELLYRQEFGQPCLQQPDVWATLSDSGPLLGEDADWARSINANLPNPDVSPPAGRPDKKRFRQTLARVFRRGNGSHDLAGKSPVRPPIGWIPATRYQQYWRSMRAFALPSYYDGRIRINLKGREHGGIVPLSEYNKMCDMLEALLLECRDPVTGACAVDFIERAGDANPLDLGETESDLVVVWKGVLCALEHPKHGRIGPLPLRRPGGHTGRYGMACFNRAGLETGDRGVRSSFDLVPTLFGLLGEPVPDGLSGSSLLEPGMGATRMDSV